MLDENVLVAEGLAQLDGSKSRQRWFSSSRLSWPSPVRIGSSTVKPSDQLRRDAVSSEPELPQTDARGA